MTTRGRIRLGMFLIGGAEWRGGLNYQRTVLEALAGPLSDRFEARLFVSPDQLTLAMELFNGLLTLPPVVDARAAGAGTGRRALEALVVGTDRGAAALMAEHQIDVVFENARFLGRNFPVPAISWMPDFQHRALQHLFTRRGWWKRDIGFRAQTLGRRVVLLSSNTAQADCEIYYPRCRGRTSVVRFAPTVDADAVFARRDNTRRTYGLPEQFFYLPNQFWAHKNHAIVLDALSIIRDRGQLETMPPVVMSGPVSDNRRGTLFGDVMAKAEAQGLSPWFRHLGLIPMPDVLALNAAACAVLNPSLFEGWASSVEEAKALGSPMILSDIPVHREQAPDARFFAPSRAKELAHTLLAVAKAPPVRTEDPAELAEQTNRRSQAFVGALAATLDRAHALRSLYVSSAPDGEKR